MHVLISVAGIILTILFVVGTHEFGHFLMARLLGVKVLTFSIGFGKRLFGWKDKSGTDYVVALIPLGGYVRMLDETEGKVAAADLPKAYNNQPFYKKFLIVAAGPLTNFICAIALYWAIFCIGFVTLKPIIGEVTPGSIAAQAGLKPLQEIVSVNQESTPTWTKILFRILSQTGDEAHINLGVVSAKDPTPKQLTLDLTQWRMDDLNPDPFVSLGFKPYDPPIKLEIGYINPDSPAATANLKLGDKLIAIDGRKITDWVAFITEIQEKPDQAIKLTIKRNNETLIVPITLGSKHHLISKSTGSLGIAPVFTFPESLQQKIKYGPITAIGKALDETYELTVFNLIIFGKMLTGKLSLQSLGGPITIFDSAGDSLNYGFIPFLSFLAFLSISIGIINIIPIPGLDGGHLLIQAIEALIGRPVPEKIVMILYKAGFLFLMFILATALVNDILRLL